MSLNEVIFKQKIFYFFISFFLFKNFTITNFIKNHKKKLAGIVAIGILLYCKEKFKNINYNNEQFKAFEELKKKFYKDLELESNSVLIKNNKEKLTKNLNKDSIYNNNMQEENFKKKAEKQSIFKIQLYDEIDKYKTEIQELKNKKNLFSNFDLIFDQINFVKKVIDFEKKFQNQLKDVQQKTIKLLNKNDADLLKNEYSDIILKKKQFVKNEEIDGFFIKWLNLIKKDENFYYNFIDLILETELNEEKEIIDKKQEIDDEVKELFKERIKKTILIESKITKLSQIIEEFKKKLNDKNEEFEIFFQTYFEKFKMEDIKYLYIYEYYILFNNKLIQNLNDYFNNYYEEDKNNQQPKKEDIQNNQQPKQKYIQNKKEQFLNINDFVFNEKIKGLSALLLKDVNSIKTKEEACEINDELQAFLENQKNQLTRKKEISNEKGFIITQIDINNFKKLKNDIEKIENKIKEIKEFKSK